MNIVEKAPGQDTTGQDTTVQDIPGHDLAVADVLR